MKKSVMILVSCICLGTTGCGTNTKTDGAAATTQEKTEAVITDEIMTEETETTTQEEISSVQLDEGDLVEYVTSIEMVDYSRDVKADDGALLFKVTQNCPDVTIDSAVAAADNVNDFYLKEKDAFDAMIEEHTQVTKEDYADLSEEDKAGYNEYMSGLEDSLIKSDLGLEYSLKRADDQCISIVKDSYGYTGAHPTNASREAAVFDTATGEQLTFDSIFEDADKAKSFITDYLANKLKKKYKDVLFEDYEKDIPSILDDNTWYLSKAGFVFICNEYIITSYLTGIQEFTIPYDKLEGFSDLYKPDVKK